MVGPRYLLDTNAVSALLKQPDGPVARRLSRHTDDDLCTSIVVECELRYGAAKRGSPRLTARIEALLRELAIVPLEIGADRRYGAIRLALEKQGTPIGQHDLLIAAQALAMGVTLVTENVREFSRVPGLAVENWNAAEP